MKKYIVKLAKDERADLSKLIAQGKASARKLTHARILLKADSSQDGPGWTDEAISEALEVGTATVERVRQRGDSGGNDGDGELTACLSAGPRGH